MTDDIDVLIDKCLRQISLTKDCSLLYPMFSDIGYDKAKRLAEIMQDKGLIILDQQLCSFRDLAYTVIKQGGWIAHLDIQAEEKKQEEADKASQRHNTKLDIVYKYLGIIGMGYVFVDILALFFTKVKFGLLSYLIQLLFNN